MIKIYIDIQMLHKNDKVFKAAIQLLKQWQAKGYEITIEKDDQLVHRKRSSHSNRLRVVNRCGNSI